MSIPQPIQAHSEKDASSGVVEGVVGNRDAKDDHNGPERNQDTDSGNELHFQDQSSRMPLKKILVVYLGIGNKFHLDASSLLAKVHHADSILLFCQGLHSWSLLWIRLLFQQQHR